MKTQIDVLPPRWMLGMRGKHLPRTDGGLSKKDREQDRDWLGTNES
jgi:hypothetical protein